MLPRQTNSILTVFTGCFSSLVTALVDCAANHLQVEGLQELRNICIAYRGQGNVNACRNDLINFFRF